MTTDFARPATPGAQEPRRDRWGRPLIVPPGGGEPIAYTRVSTLSKCIEDTSNLSKWMQRMVAVGIGKRPDLQALAGVLDPDADKSKLNDLAEQAMNAAKSGQAANLGTVLHSYTEWVDEAQMAGQPLEPLYDRMQPELVPTVRNYVAAKAAQGIKPMAMERFVVCDELQAAGSFDRLEYHPLFGIVVDDTKTGDTAPQYPHAIAMQVAIYAHSQLYDIETGTRTPIPGVNTEVGILTHLSQKTGECVIYSLDIARGWKAAQLAAEVHAWRKEKGLVTAL